MTAMQKWQRIWDWGYNRGYNLWFDSVDLERKDCSLKLIITDRSKKLGFHYEAEFDAREWESELSALFFDYMEAVSMFLGIAKPNLW